MVRVFKADGKTYYAVTDNPSVVEAVKEVIRYKKASLSTVNDYNLIFMGRIVKNKDLLELWKSPDTDKGELCWVITKK